MATSSRGIRLLKVLEIISKMNPAPFDKQVIDKVQLTSIDNGTIKGWFTVEPDMCNLGGMIHGGFIASVVDTLTFYAQLSNTEGRVSLTTTMAISFIAPGQIGEKVTVETKCLRNGRNSVIEAYLHNQKGILIAKGINSYVAAPEKYNTLAKELFKFNIYEN